MKINLTQEVQARIAVMLFALLGPGILYSLWRTNLAPSLESYWWPSVNGKVADIIVVPKLNAKNRMRYHGRARYQYSVGGKEYTSERTSFGEDPRNTEEEAIDAMARFRPGKIVPVYYNPRDPAIAVVIPGMFAHQIAAVLMLVGLSVLGIGVCARSFVRWLKDDKTLPPNILEKFG
jgi:hypothetical protein